MRKVGGEKEPVVSPDNLRGKTMSTIVGRLSSTGHGGYTPGETFCVSLLKFQCYSGTKCGAIYTIAYICVTRLRSE